MGDKNYTYAPKQYCPHGCTVIEDEVMTPDGKMDRYKDKRSLCWSCQNATNGGKCPWARSFEPVRGWEAEKTHINGNGKGAKGYESYNVKQCPLYRADREEV